VFEARVVQLAPRDVGTACAGCETAFQPDAEEGSREDTEAHLLEPDELDSVGMAGLKEAVVGTTVRSGFRCSGKLFEGARGPTA